MKRSIIFLLGLIATVRVVAQSPIKAVTPFTGMDYVRLVIATDSKPTTQYKVVITGTQDHKVLWQGPVTPTPINTPGINQVSYTIKNLKPHLWTPADPYLYEINVQQLSGNKVIGEVKDRLGFRSITSQNGHIMLNGKPIFLRGIAINPPGRGIPGELEQSRQFALDYVKYMKSINVNIIRIPNTENWYNVCDELGMMVFGGNYSGTVDGEKPPVNYDKAVNWYEQKEFSLIAHHPSLMIYAMTNETPYAGSEVPAWEKFLSYAADKLKQWDETRLYIANAGYGYGKAGDICDIHRYWGWYYSSPFTFLHIRYNADLVPFPKKMPQPITFTECVGNYTGPDGRYNLNPAHKNPSSQLAWTGHEREDLQAHLADEHQTLTFRNATELFRQLRVINPELSGLFPFTILFYNWDTITKFDDMKPKPVTEQVRLSYQPILLSWECWTPHVYAGTTVKTIAHVINDDNEFNDLINSTMVYQLFDKTKTAVLTDSIKLQTIPYYGSIEKQVDLKLPQNLVSGNYTLRGKIMRNGKQISENYFNFFVADPQFTAGSITEKANLQLYDPNGKTAAALKKLNVNFNSLISLQNLTANSTLIIGENDADNNINQNAAVIKDFVSKGGRVITMRQDSIHTPNLNAMLDTKLTNSNIDIDNPVYPVSSIYPRNGYYVNPERPDNPVFAGITRENLKVWSDYTNWNESQKGFPAIYPVTDGFSLQNRDDLAHTTILGNYSSGLESIVLAEQFSGKGSVMLCGFDLVNRAGLDPVADKLLLNMVNYASSSTPHNQYQLITAPITWGEYETEKGIVTDIYSGFLVNSTPRLTPEFAKKGITISKEGYQIAGNSSVTFNTRPGLQYVANGRRPFGPYEQTFGGKPSLGSKPSPEGVGKFWCRIPEGQNICSTVVWNPSPEALELRIKINNQSEISRQIPAGEKITVSCPVDSTNVGMIYTGDRRLVILETAFKKSNP
jgi:beta-galactosidase